MPANDKWIYSAFDALRLPMIILVIYIHNDVALIPGRQYASDRFLVGMISHGIASSAVPLFFFMSGFLFFFRSAFSADEYRRKIANRTRTLLIPYVFWNLSLAALILVVARIPFTSSLLDGSAMSIDYTGPLEFLDRVFGVTHFPIAYQFWFVRDLIVLVVLAPVFWYALRLTIGWIFPCTFFVIWALQLWPIHFPAVLSIAAFSSGAFVSIHNINPFPSDRIALPALAVALGAFLLDLFVGDSTMSSCIHAMGAVSIVACLLSLAPAFSQTGVGRSMIKLSVASFFVYAMHEPTLTVIRAVAEKWGSPIFPDWLSYLALPLVVTMLGIGSYFLLARLLPTFTSVITGGRVSAATSSSNGARSH